MEEEVTSFVPWSPVSQLVLLPWPAGGLPPDHRPRPWHPCWVSVSLGVTTVHQNPLCLLWVSVNLEGLLILTDITLGLFTLNFFSLKNVKKHPTAPKVSE